MKYVTQLNEKDLKLGREALQGFLPEEVFDIHTHPYNPRNFAPGAWSFLDGVGQLGCKEHREALQRYMPVKTIHGLYFAMPNRTLDRPAENEWVAQEVEKNGTSLSRALLVVSPSDDRSKIAAQLDGGRFCGLKVYHWYSGRPDTMHAEIEEFAPEWMWEMLHERQGVLLLHMVRQGAISDRHNQETIQRLCRAYPNMRLILAHVARSFNYRNAREGLHMLADLDNVVVDTSAVTESETMRAALEILGPKKVLWGSDFAVSEIRGRCVSTGDAFFWLSPEVVASGHQAPTSTEMTLVGIESLLCLREACEDSGLNAGELKDIFLNNALRLLGPHLPQDSLPELESGINLWQRAKEVVSCGTGLLSKRAEMFDVKQWPSYFSRSSGCEVWDLEGKRYLDFAGGIGAVFLGYADPAVNAALRRRINLGTYSSLVSPQEVELAELLLGLHPWAGKVRYARGGGEAMTMAVRIARAATGKSGVAFCGYHGWHDWYLAANLGSENALDGHLLPGLSPVGVPRELAGTSYPFHYNNLEELHAALDRLDGNLAAVVMEPMRSQWPKDDFLAKAAKACRERGAVFIVDEITSGLRYGFPGALSRFGIDPDIAVYAKALGNGTPFAAVIGRDEVMNAADGSFISSSYWTDGLGSAAALAVLKKVQQGSVHEVVWNRGSLLQKNLEELAARHPACRLVVGGMPSTPVLSFDLGGRTQEVKTLFVRKMSERGILVGGIFYLMLAHSEEKIARLLETLDVVLFEIGEIITSGIFESDPLAKESPAFARLA